MPCKISGYIKFDSIGYVFTYTQTHTRPLTDLNSKLAKKEKIKNIHEWLILQISGSKAKLSLCLRTKKLQQEWS